MSKRFPVLVKLDHIEQLAGYLADIRRRAENPTELMDAVGIIMRASFAENFNVGGRPEPWQPLALETILEKMALFAAGLIRGRKRGVRVRVPRGQINAGSMPGILIRTGRLKDAASRKGAQGNIHRIINGGRGIEVGVGPLFVPENPYGPGKRRGRMKTAGRLIPYGAYHNDPARFGISRLPRRQFLLVQEEDMERIHQAAEVFLLGGDVRAFLKGQSQ